MTAGLLVIMGSGETAPTMVKPHREIFTRVGGRPAVLVDTPYGFQENADDISSRAVGYFAASVGQQIDVVSWRTPPPSGLPRERALAALRDAGWLFAGPGSPTYALRQWTGTEFPDALTSTLDRDGVVVFASAAALTLGSHTVPVYEIYKAGIEPHWVPGLDLVHRLTGLPVVVIPHFDNAEGGSHDTRFCYLGERRLAVLERSLPEETFILGIDEHTAVMLDLAARTATVLGNGVLTVRRRGTARAYPAGSVVGFAELAAESTASTTVTPGSVADAGAAAGAVAGAGAAAGAAAGARAGAGAAAAARAAAGAGAATNADPTVPERPNTSLRADTEEQVKRFDAALAARDVDGCVAAVLDLEQALQDWMADTDVSDERDQARAALRRMVVRLGELAVAGARDPRDVVGPYVEALLELRRRSRETRDYATSDWIRDHLTAAGVEVRDTPDGVHWSL